MTEAVVQNKIIKDLTSNLIQYPTNEGGGEGFSTLMKNITSKVEQTKTNFVDKAVKSNTSSINKYALKDNKIQSQPQKSIQTSEKITQTDKTKKFNKNELQTKNLKTKNTENLKDKNNIALKSDTKKTVSKNKTTTAKNAELSNKSSVNTNQTDAKTSSLDKEGFSENVNNDSLESSPVSLESASDENIQTVSQGDKAQTIKEFVEKTQDEIKTIIENILVTFDIPIDSNSDNSIDIKGIFDSLTDENGLNSDSIVKAIDNISSQIDNMDLSKENKDKILLIADKLKSAVKEIADNVELDETIKDVKNILDSAVLNKLSTKKEISKEELDKTPLKVNVQQSEMNEVSKETQNNDKQIEVEQSKKEIESQNNTNKIVLDDSLKAEKENNTETLKDIKFGKTQQYSSNEEDEIKVTDNKNNTDEKDNKIKIEENDSIDEIVSKLKEFENSSEYVSLEKDDKIKIEQTIKKLSDINDDKVKKDGQEILEDVKEEINTIIKTDEKTTTTKEDDEVKISKNTQIEIPKQTDTSLQDEGNNFNQPNENQKNNILKAQKNTEKITVDKKTDIKEIEFVEDNKIDSEAISQSDIDEIDTDIEQTNNKPKQSEQVKLSGSIVKELKEDFLEDVSYSTETPSALSVSDEIIKMALDENNTISAKISPVGNVTYDSANSAVTIKNVQNITYQEAKETVSNNVMNQISDKLVQLKDSQKLTLVLRPDDLGRLSIELKTDKNGLTTNILAQNEQVRSYIEKNINTLRSQLSEAGINVNSIQIKTAGESSSSTYDGNLNKEFKQEEQNQGQNQNQQQNKQKNPEKEFISNANYEMHFVKDFSSVMSKTLSYIN